jgi:hypothetical protein
MSWRFFVPFAALPLVQRVLYTGTLSVLAMGYLFAMIHVFSSHAGRDGDPMLSVDDIIIAYSGNKSSTTLESAINGPMANMLVSDERARLIYWVQGGAKEAAYEDDVKAIFTQRCIACHSDRNPHLPDLSTFEGVSHVTEQDKGMDLFTLIRVSHIHLFGLTFIFFMVGAIFCHAMMRNETLKVIIVALPFVAILLDIASWYATKIYEPFAWVVILSGGLMALSFAIQVTVSIAQMWFVKLPSDVAGDYPPDRRGHHR